MLWRLTSLQALEMQMESALIATAKALITTLTLVMAVQLLLLV